MSLYIIYLFFPFFIEKKNFLLFLFFALFLFNTKKNFEMTFFLNLGYKMNLLIMFTSNLTTSGKRVGKKKKALWCCYNNTFNFHSLLVSFSLTHSNSRFSFFSKQRIFWGENFCKILICLFVNFLRLKTFSCEVYNFI